MFERILKSDLFMLVPLLYSFVLPACFGWRPCPSPLNLMFLGLLCIIITGRIGELFVGQRK